MWLLRTLPRQKELGFAQAALKVMHTRKQQNL
jgi:hypothetical protein